MSIHNPSRLLNKRNRLSFRKKKKLINIITSKYHIDRTIDGAIRNNNMALAISLIDGSFKVNYKNKIN